MKKFICTLLIVVMLVGILSGCGANQKTEEEIKAELRAELEAEAKKEEALREQIKSELEADPEQSIPADPDSTQTPNQNSGDSVNNNQASTKSVRKSLTNENIEAIALDLMSSLDLFSETTLNLDSKLAESFACYLVFKKDKQHILNNYISDLENLISNDIRTKNDDKVDGKYIEALSEAIFNVNINPEPVYVYQPSDIGLAEVQLKDSVRSDNKYIATLNILDMMDTPYLSMELCLSLTSEGNTRIESVSTKVLTNDTASEFNEIIDIKDIKAGMPFNDMTVKNVTYKPNNELLIELSGELGFEGSLCYDDYFGAFYFSSDGYEFAQKIKIDDNTILQLPAEFVIKNDDLLKSELSQETIDKMKSDYNYTVYSVLTIKSYMYGIKFNEYYQDSAAELLEVLEIQK